MAERSRACSSGRGRASSILLPTLLLAGCTEPAADLLPGVPEGAVPVGEHLYAVPVAAPDEDGCQAWRLWSPDRMVDQALRWRRADGGFSMNKLEAACLEGHPRERY